MISASQFGLNDLISVVFSDDVELIESRVYSKPFIYKYFYFSNLTNLQEFLSRPTIKFTNKDDLNDPFELTRRWGTFGCPFKQEAFEKHLRARLKRKISDITDVRKRLATDVRTKELGLSRQERRRIVAERLGKIQMQAAYRGQEENLTAIARSLPAMFQEQEDALVEGFAKDTGILSLTEDPNDAYMWREYAEDGEGFVLKFDAKNPFFFHYERGRKVRSLLRKVLYRDDKIEEFWTNPYYLFLVKETKWRFEKEWRVLRALDQCNKRVLEDGKALYLADMPAGLIKEIIFGYRWSRERVDKMGALIQQYDNKIEVSTVAMPS